MRRLRPGFWIVACWGFGLGSIGCVSTGPKPFPSPASSPGNFTQTPWNPSLGIRKPAAASSDAGSVEIAANEPTTANATLLKHFPGLAKRPGYLRGPVGTWTKSSNVPPAETVADRNPSRTVEAVAQVEDSQEEEIPVLHVNIRFDPIEDEPTPNRETVVVAEPEDVPIPRQEPVVLLDSKAEPEDVPIPRQEPVVLLDSNPEPNPEPIPRQEPVVLLDSNPEPIPRQEPVVLLDSKAEPEDEPIRERIIERRVSYDFETPSTVDPAANSRSTDFAIAEADAPPRRRDAHSHDPKFKRKPYTALTDVSPRLLFPKSYYESPSQSRSADTSEPGVKQAAWRPLDSPSKTAAPNSGRRGPIRRTWERFARRFAPPEPIVR